MSPRAQVLGNFLKKGPMTLHIRQVYNVNSYNEIVYNVIRYHVLRYACNAAIQKHEQLNTTN